MPLGIGFGGPTSSVTEQRITNMMSKGTVYRFDGADDVITVTDSAEIQDIFASGGFISADIYPKSDGEGDNGRIVDKSSNATSGYELFVTGESGDNVAIRFKRESTTSDATFITGAVVPLNKWSNITVVYDDSTYATISAVIYVNGVAQSLATDTKGGGAGISDAGDDLNIGNRDAGDSTFDGEIASVMLGNFAPTAAEVKDLISGNLPFKWQYGSQVSVVTGTDSTFAGAGNWTGANLGTFDVNTSVAGKAYMLGNGGDDYMQLTTALTIGKYYTVSLKAELDPLDAGGMASTMLRMGNIGSASADNWFNLTPTTTEGTFTGKFLASGTTLSIGLLTAEGGFSGIAFSIDDVEVMPAGAVALYDQDSISSTTWHDKSGNGNDGAVTGAEVLNAPSVTPLLAMHTDTIRIAAGGTPTTNITCSAADRNTWGQEAITTGTNIAKDGSDGSFALSSDGKVLTLNLTKDVVGITGYGMRQQDVENSSSTVVYYPSVLISGGNITISFFKRAVSGSVDILSMVTSTGDLCDFWISYVTAT